MPPLKQDRTPEIMEWLEEEHPHPRRFKSYDDFALYMLPHIAPLYRKWFDLSKIGRALEAKGLRPLGGDQWNAIRLSKLIRRIKELGYEKELTKC